MSLLLMVHLLLYSVILYPLLLLFLGLHDRVDWCWTECTSHMAKSESDVMRVCAVPWHCSHRCLDGRHTDYVGKSVSASQTVGRASAH
jgi:hypothetical protein